MQFKTLRGKLGILNFLLINFIVNFYCAQVDPIEKLNPMSQTISEKYCINLIESLGAGYKILSYYKLLNFQTII